MTCFTDLKTNLLTDVLALNSDSYKTTQWMQLPDGSGNGYSYVEPRGSDHDFTMAVQWGLTAIIKKFLMKPVTMRDIDRAKKFVDRHIGDEVFNYEGWKRIVEVHGGKLPLRIRALKEGSVVPLRNVMIAVESTDPECAWLVTYLEPLILQVWYSTTVASLSHAIYGDMKEFFEATVDDELFDRIRFKLHDFGFRGASVPQAGEIGGGGHLLTFLGTDTMRAVAGLYDYYNLDEDDDNSMPAFSVIASEHSTMCANADADTRNDYASLEKMVSILERVAKKRPGAIVAAVADSYDPFRFATWVGTDFKDRIINSGGTFVVRPDSGDPLVIPIQIIEILMEHFGYTINSKGYKVLPDCIRVLQGDGVNRKSIRAILQKMKDMGLSADNIVFGMGGALLQQVDRDKMKFAMKGSALEVDGKWKDLYKDPITDSIKRSKRGRVTTFKDQAGEYFSDRLELMETNHKIVDQLEDYFLNGELMVDEVFTDIRTRKMSFE